VFKSIHGKEEHRVKEQKKQKEKREREIDRHKAKEAVKDIMCQITQTRQMMTKKRKDLQVVPKETSKIG